MVYYYVEGQTYITHERVSRKPPRPLPPPLAPGPSTHDLNQVFV